MNQADARRRAKELSTDGTVAVAITGRPNANGDGYITGGYTSPDDVWIVVENRSGRLLDH